MYADEDTKCQLCKVETETLEHLLLDCTEPLNIRNPILRTDSGYIPSSYGIRPMSTINISSNADTTRHHQNIESVEINR